MGYHRAGFEVVGVDMEPQPHYPFEFHLGEAMTWPLDGYDAIHASPPCQGYSRMRHLPWLRDKVYPLLIEPTRERLRPTGLPWIIENVEDAPLVRGTTMTGEFGVLLCGTMFGLPIYRHRPFESSRPLAQLAHGEHRHIIQAGRGVANRARIPSWEPASRMTDVMGCEWMNQHECGQAIPPAYTEFIGRQLLDQIGR